MEGVTFIGLCLPYAVEHYFMENNNICIKFYKGINKEKPKNIELDFIILFIKK